MARVTVVTTVFPYAGTAHGGDVSSVLVRDPPLPPLGAFGPILLGWGGGVASKSEETSPPWDCSHSYSRAQKYPVWVRLAEHYPGNGPR